MQCGNLSSQTYSWAPRVTQLFHKPGLLSTPINLCVRLIFVHALLPCNMQARRHTRSPQYRTLCTCAAATRCSLPGRGTGGHAATLLPLSCAPHSRQSSSGASPHSGGRPLPGPRSARRRGDTGCVARGARHACDAHAGRCRTRRTAPASQNAALAGTPPKLVSSGACPASRSSQGSSSCRPGPGQPAPEPPRTAPSQPHAT